MEPSPLVYDTAAAAAVWQRVGPAAAGLWTRHRVPRGPAAAAAAGDGQRGDAGRADREGAALYACCRRCAVRAPRQSPAGAGTAGREEQRAVRALLAAYFLHTGRWRQPPAPAAGVRETWLAALRRVYVGEAVVQRGCAIWRRAWRTAACGSCWRRRRIARRNGENGWQTCWKKP